MCQHDEQPEVVCRDAEPEREADGGGSDDNKVEREGEQHLITAPSLSGRH